MRSASCRGGAPVYLAQQHASRRRTEPAFLLTPGLRVLIMVNPPGGRGCRLSRRSHAARVLPFFMSKQFSGLAWHTAVRRVGTAVGVASLSWGLTAQAAPVVTVIAEDSFSYAPGISVVGQNGGSGWSGDWIYENQNFSQLEVVAGSLSVPGVPGAGGHLVYAFNGLNELGHAARTLPLQDTGVVFVQFLSQFGAQSGGGSPTVRVGDVWVGNNGGCGSSVYALIDRSAGVFECTTVLLSTLSAIVLRIDYTAQTTQMWVLPSLSGFDYLNPPAPTVQRAGFAPQFSRFSLYARDPASIDELKVFRVADVVAAPLSPQPVPANFWSTLGALTGLVFLAGWWRRRRR